jgi:hypothetical protein
MGTIQKAEARTAWNQADEEPWLTTETKKQGERGFSERSHEKSLN